LWGEAMREIFLEDIEELEAEKNLPVDMRLDFLKCRKRKKSKDKIYKPKAQ
jgi:hypothetical protein